MKIIIPVSRLRRLTFWILFFFSFSFSAVFCQENNSESQPSATRQPHNSVTGKLNQFNGFYTPRPLPSNANFVYASIWASWSAWSFCANNVQIRVRACNTVRGFTCPGANQERKPCGQSASQNRGMRQRQRVNTFGGDYDAVDPWEEDRREALKQLYSDYTPPDEPQKPPAPPLRSIGKSLKPSGDFVAVQRSAGKTAFSSNGYGNGPPIAPLRSPPENGFNKKFHADGPGQAPSMTPELLFGSKIEIPTKPIKSSSSESNEQKLEGINDERREDVPTTTTTTTSTTDIPKPISQEMPTTTTTDIPTVSTTTTTTTIVIAETAQTFKVPIQTSETPVEIIEVPEEGKFVPSTETNQNPLKMHMNHEVTFGRDEELKQGGIMEDITKTDFPIQNVEETDGSIEVDKEEGGDSKGEVFGEAAVTDILPHLELTTQSHVSEVQVAPETTATIATSHFEKEQPEEFIADLPSEASVDPNNEPSETDSDVSPIDPNLSHQNQPGDSKSKNEGDFSSFQEINKIPQIQIPPSQPSEIPPHAAFENDDDSDLMSPQQPQQQEEQQQQHFKHPTIKISPSKSKSISISEEHGTLPKDEMYDDQFETQNIRTTISPEDKIKQLEEDMDDLESQITKKLHSGEVSFNKDTEKALEWMLANMTKAAEEAALRQEQLEREKQAKQHHQHIPPVHSGEIEYHREGHEGETNGMFGKAHVFDNRQFAAKISPLDSPITLRKIQPEMQKQHFDHLKYQHAKVKKPIELKVKSEQQNPEADLLESDLKKLRTEMAKMESELVALQGDTSIVEVNNNQRTTIGPNLKAIDLELVPKAPPKAIIGGPNTPIVTIGNDGEMFLLDVPSEKGEAQWSSWKPWNDCFCDKQIRTRSCNYDSSAHSKGCQGKSFESRPCITSRPCPAKIALKRNQARTTPNPLNSNGLYTLAPQKGPRTGYAFKPNPLSLAISSSSSSSSSSQTFN